MEEKIVANERYCVAYRRSHRERVGNGKITFEQKHTS